VARALERQRASEVAKAAACANWVALSAPRWMKDGASLVVGKKPGTTGTPGIIGMGKVWHGDGSVAELANLPVNGFINLAGSTSEYHGKPGLSISNGIAAGAVPAVAFGDGIFPLRQGVGPVGEFRFQLVAFAQKRGAFGFKFAEGKRFFARFFGEAGELFAELIETTLISALDQLSVTNATRMVGNSLNGSKPITTPAYTFCPAY
jgi:hypothetical protein